MRTMRDVWISWHSLPVVSTGGGSDLTGCVFLCTARFFFAVFDFLTPFADAPPHSTTAALLTPGYGLHPSIHTLGHANGSILSETPTTLEECRLLIAQLRNQIQDSIRQLDESNARNAQLDAQLNLLSNPQPRDSAYSICSSGFINGNNRRGERFLRDIFNRYKNANGVLCGPNLAQAMRDADAPIIPETDQELADIINEFDVSCHGNLGFSEFWQAANAPDDALRHLVGRCSDQLKRFGQLSPHAIQHSAAAIASALPMILKELHQQIQDAFVVESNIEAEMNADPSKFNDFYKMACGSVADFHTGLTGRVGMPHLNFKHTMRQEHCERAGCDVAFTTGNYKITTTPAKEWLYVTDNASCPDMGHSRQRSRVVLFNTSGRQLGVCCRLSSNRPDSCNWWRRQRRQVVAVNNS